MSGLDIVWIARNWLTLDLKSCQRKSLNLYAYYEERLAGQHRLTVDMYKAAYVTAPVNFGSLLK
jgi:hypothetical protein